MKRQRNLRANGRVLSARRRLVFDDVVDRFPSKPESETTRLPVGGLAEASDASGLLSANLQTLNSRLLLESQSQSRVADYENAASYDLLTHPLLQEDDNASPCKYELSQRQRPRQTCQERLNNHEFSDSEEAESANRFLHRRMLHDKHVFADSKIMQGESQCGLAKPKHFIQSPLMEGVAIYILLLCILFIFLTFWWSGLQIPYGHIM